ncbi:unnamed protein product [Brassicogethes aeneus]|uniref:J domain-containing protein n=1 Tax=Brassicogethes aeneus TaxID=1431903 RepID=A0A9P0B1S7_BRAAE|nr:unnamed protein product [Brassicogethes aeneus]
MSDKNRNYTNGAMEKIIGNITGEMQNSDGQYVPLAFTPPPTTQMNWNQPQNSYINHYNINEPPRPAMDHYNANFYANQSLYEPSPFQDFEAYKPSNPDLNLLDRLFTPSVQHIPDNLMQNQPVETSHTLIDNLVGNWVMPNNSGTYTPFGTDTFKPNVFEIHYDRDNNSSKKNHQFYEDTRIIDEEKQFPFGRDPRKPRMVAEVKPMRPSYSDVLTKPVPTTQTNTKPVKNDVNKEQKPKKDNKKQKSDKIQKNINRSNITMENRDLNTQKPEKIFKNTAKNQLPRKWASLDNISEKPEEKKKKSEITNKPNKKINKTVNDIEDSDQSDTLKTETFSTSKNGVKKITKPIGRNKPNDSFGSNNERPPGKRNQRTRKRETHVPFGVFGQKLKQYTKGWWKLITVFVLWLFNLISDICSLSIHISKDLAFITWTWLRVHCSLFLETTNSIFKNIRLFNWIRDKFKGRKRVEEEDEQRPFTPKGLQNNINMPTTGDEAMRRLLACKGKDPYSILGVAPACTDDDIKRYYKRQAFLVHPDKNPLPGAEEAFKILVHAFDMICEPERRAAYDRGVVESAQVVQAWSELNDLLQQLQQKVEAAANTIRCSACGFRHKRIKVERPSYAARNCNTCKIHHAAREGDIWAEARVMGFLWHYFACMEGNVYDITEWAGCQKESLKHLRPDSHHVQYRIALGKQSQPPRRNSASPRTDRPDLENLLNTLYGQQNDLSSQGTRRRNKKANK